MKTIIRDMFSKLPNSFMLTLIKTCSIFNKEYAMAFEEIRMNAYVERTDFSTLDVGEWPVCYINKGTWDYPLFHMYFLDNMLANVIYCLSKGYRPIVNVCNSEEKINLWEQFLLQSYCSESDNNLKIGEGDIECDVTQALFYKPLFPTEQDIMKYSTIYKNLVVLNPKTQHYFENEYNSILKDRKVVGVLCRGTDYTENKPKGHPVQPSVEDVISLVRTKIDELGCEYIYLATDEKKILDAFVNVFGQRVLTNNRHYYDDFYRLKEENGDVARISWVHFDRENDNYYKSLEYFSSVMLLSRCEALIGGNCGGSRTALYLNDGKYRFWHLFNLGVY